MSFFTSYCENWERVIPACIIDNRASIPAIKNKDGFTIKAYLDSQLALVTEDVLVYRVETADCNLAGFFSLQVNRDTRSSEKIMEVLRPAFQGNTEISLLITNFINGGSWRNDFLF